MSLGGAKSWLTLRSACCTSISQPASAGFMPAIEKTLQTHYGAGMRCRDGEADARAAAGPRSGGGGAGLLDQESVVGLAAGGE